MITEIIYEAKCKHCVFFEKGRVLKNNGEESKRVIHFCNNKESELDHQMITLKDKACDKIQLL
ncbi:hypothetical protein BC792_12716 [Sphingobacterium allocomposti]|uniref:Uncharacterized protein n=1 Tax=Sphingobacterium allocomposti TaxID=415956 RepID=A0A5S5D0X7_9SPHI|nr:hypothetical protein BC792_12716 [Sphingobacterium composti Yoo et al. 2007 non Ten et al. 2007]